MKLARRDRVAVVLIGGLALALMGGGSAYAYWTTTGTGTGGASATTFVAPTVQFGTATGELYPGATNVGDLALTASNPNAFAISVTVAQSGTPSCAVSFSGGTFTLTANEQNKFVTLADTVSMGTGAGNECQGAAITVNLSTASTTQIS